MAPPHPPPGPPPRPRPTTQFPAWSGRAGRPAAALLAALLAVMPLPADARTAATGTPEPWFSWPLSPAPAVTRAFDVPSGPYGPGHRGADLTARVGQEVVAAGAGVVVFAGAVAGRGVVSIDHDGGLRTTYEPVRPSVRAGEQVHRGRVVGAVATTRHPGCRDVACVHWGVRRGTEYLDPLRLVRVDTPLRLKPWEGVAP